MSNSGAKSDQRVKLIGGLYLCPRKNYIFTLNLKLVKMFEVSEFSKKILLIDIYQ
jgi:hypothetical protein